ncbi:MAG: hypothetical protein QXP36_05570 [Conexivisphaerales archaeon]
MLRFTFRSLLGTVIFSVLLANPLYAGYLSLKTGVEYFHVSYANHSSLNAQHETGDFYGIYITPLYYFANTKIGKPYAETTFAFAYANTSFTGSSFYTPISFHHPNSYIKVEAHLGLQQTLNKVVMKEYLIVGWHEWNMYKKASFDEYMHSFYYGAGVNLSFLLTDRFQLGLDLSTRIAPSGNLLSHTDESYPKIGLVKYDMGTGYNYKIKVPVKYKINDKVKLELIPYFSRWHYNQSNTKTIYNLATFEPAYSYHNVGVDLGIKYQF